MPDKLTDALGGSADPKEKTRLEDDALKRMPLLRALSRAKGGISKDEAGRGLLDAVRSGLADPKEIVSDGRVAADGKPLPDKTPERASDGTIESGFAGEINDDGIVGELARDTFVEDKARNAVEQAQARGIRTLSSGYDPGRNMGWAIGEDPDGNIVRVEAAPDPEDSPFEGAGALEKTIGEEGKPSASPSLFGTEGALDGALPPALADAPKDELPPIPDDFLDALDDLDKPESKSAKFDRLVKEELRRMAGIDPFSVSAVIARNPEAFEADLAAGAEKYLREQRIAKVMKEIEQLPPSVLALAAQMKRVSTPQKHIDRLLSIALEQRRRDLKLIEEANKTGGTVPAHTIHNSGALPFFVEGRLDVDARWSPEAQRRLVELQQKLSAAHRRLSASKAISVGSVVYVDNRKATVKKIDGSFATIRFHAGPDPVHEVHVDSLSRVRAISKDPMAKFNDPSVPTIVMPGQEEELAKFKREWDKAAREGRVVIDESLKPEAGAIADPDLVEAAELLLLKKSIAEKRWRKFHNEKVNPFAGVPVLDDVYRVGIAPAVRGAAEFVDTVTLGLVPLSEMGDDDVKRSLDISAGTAGKVTRSITGGAAQGAGLVVPFGAAGRVVRGTTNIVAKGGQVGRFTAGGMRLAETPLTFSVFDTAGKLAHNIKEGNDLLDEVDEAALQGAKNGLVFAGLGIFNRALLRGVEPGRVKGATESFLTGVEFMAIQDPHAFDDPARAAGMLTAFTVMGAMHGKAPIRSTEIERTLMDMIGKSEAGLLSIVSPTLRRRVEGRKEGERDIEKLAEAELDAVVDVLKNPKEHSVQDVAEAKSVVHEIVAADALFGMGFIGNEAGFLAVPSRAELAEAGKQVAGAGARTLGVLGLPLRGALKGAGKLEGLFVDPKTGEPTKLGKPFDALAKRLTGDPRVTGKKSALSLTEDLVKWMGKGGAWVFGKAKQGRTTQEAADGFKRWTWTAAARAGEEYGAMIREMNAAKRYSGPVFTQRDAQVFQSLPVKTRIQIMDAWAQSVGSLDPGRGLIEGNIGAALTARLKDIPGIPRTIKIEGREVPVERAIQFPEFFLRTIDSVAKDLPDPQVEGLTTGEKSAAQRKVNLAGNTQRLMLMLYMQRRLGFKPQIRSEDQSFFDQVTKSEGPQAFLMRRMGDPKVPLREINESMANVAIMQDLSMKLTARQRRIPPEADGLPGSEFRVNYNPDGTLMERPLVLTKRTTQEHVDGYARLESPIVGGQAKDLFFRNDIRTDFESFSAQHTAQQSIVGRAINWIRFGKVTVSVGGTVRDMFGDLTLNYYDLGPNGIADVWRAGGVFGGRLRGLPTVKELMTLNTKISEADLTTVREKQALIAPEKSKVQAEFEFGRPQPLSRPRVIDMALSIVASGKVLPQDFHRALIKRMRNSKMDKREINEVLSGMRAVFKERLGQRALVDAAKHTRGRVGLTAAEKQALRDAGTSKAEIKKLDEQRKSSGIEAEVVLLRDWALGELALKEGVIGNTFSEAELSQYTPGIQQEFPAIKGSAWEKLREKVDKKTLDEILEAGSLFLDGNPSRTEFIRDMSKNMIALKVGGKEQMREVAGLVFDAIENGGRTQAELAQAATDARMNLGAQVWDLANRRGFANGVRLATRLRSIPDNYTKAGAWLVYLHRGMVDGQRVNTPKLAANRVNARYPSYDQIPHAFRTAGRLTGGIGANYFAEAMRISYAAARHHPYRLAIAVMSGNMLWALTQATGLTNLTDEELEELRRSRGNFTMPIPGTKRFIDYTPSMPLADVLNDSLFRIADPTKPSTAFGSSGPLNSGVEDIRTEGTMETLGAFVRPWLDPFTQDNVPLTLADSVLKGLDSFGNKIPDEERLASKRGIGGLLEPSLVGQVRKTHEALTKDVHKDGTPIDATDVISRQLGLRISEQRPEDLKRSLKQLRIQLASARKDLERAVIKANKNKQFSDEQKRDAKLEAREKFNSLRDRIKARMDEVERALEQAKR